MRDRNQLRDAQIRLIEEIKSSRGVQIVSPMGSGKTIAALTAIRDLLDADEIRAAIIVAPVRVATTVWPAEIAHWAHTHDLDYTILDGSPGRRAQRLKETHQIYIASIDNIVWLIDELRGFPDTDARWHMLVIDELSRFANPRGVRTKKLFRFCSRFDSIVGLTGTPRRRALEDQYAPIRIISGGTAWGLGFDHWRRRYCEPLDYRGYRWAVRDSSVPYIQKVIDDWTVAVPPDKAVDVMFNFGSGFDVVTPLNAAQKRDLTSLQEHLLVELGLSGTKTVEELLEDDQKVVSLSRAVASGRMSQILQGFLYRDGETVQTYENAKLDALEDLVAAAAGENLLIVYHYQHDLREILQRFGNIPVMGADTKDADFARYLEAWKAGDIPLMAVHPASVGHGVDGMQYGGYRLIWYCMTWSGELFAQMNKRLARPGQKNPVFVHRILADHWIDRLKVRRTETAMAREAEFVAKLKAV